MSLTYGNPTITSIGARYRSVDTLALDNSYPTGGYTIDPHKMGLISIEQCNVTANEQGYTFDYNTSTGKLQVYDVSGGGLTATISGTAAAQTFTGTSPTSDLNLATPAFSGTGLTASGQVITTTSTHTMTLNQCAGMWLISATGATPPNLILSNTAVSGAAAVLTVQGAASTDAGAYKIVKALTPVGTNGSSAVTGTATISGTIAMGEVPNATDLSAITGLQLIAIGQ